MTSPATVSSAPAPLQPLDPRVRTLWSLAAGLAALPVVLVALAVGFGVDLGAAGPVLAVATTALVIAGAVLGPGLRYRRWRYALGEDELEIRRGVLWTTVTVIPYSRLQFVDTKQGPLDRLFGLASLVVHTAAPGTSGTLPGLAVETAAVLRQRLAAVDADDDDPSV